MRIGNRIEELSLNHWPALVTMARGGWLLRFADGYTKRANSVSAIYGEEGGEEELEERIAWCERRFAELGVPAVFKMTSFDRPAGLDGLLDKRGYGQRARAAVCTGSSALRKCIAIGTGSNRINDRGRTGRTIRQTIRRTACRSLLPASCRRGNTALRPARFFRPVEPGRTCRR